VFAQWRAAMEQALRREWTTELGSIEIPARLFEPEMLRVLGAVGRSGQSIVSGGDAAARAEFGAVGASDAAARCDGR
jgi:hypothetical protein